MRPVCPYTAPYAPPDVMAACPGFTPALITMQWPTEGVQPLLTCRNLGMQRHSGRLGCVCLRPDGVPVAEVVVTGSPAPAVAGRPTAA